MKLNKILIMMFSIYLFLGMLVIIPSCFIHPDYVSFERSIEKYIDTGNIYGEVNGKHLLLLLFGNFYKITESFLTIEESMIFLSLIFSGLNLYMIYKISKDIYKLKKRLLLLFFYTGTTTYITLLGSPESVIISTFFILLSFYYFEKNRFISGFILLTACFIRSDNIFFFIPFVMRLEWRVIPFFLIAVGNLMLNSHKSDIGFNILSFIPLTLSIGLLFIYFYRINRLKNPDWNLVYFLMPCLIYLFLVVEQSQKIYFVFIPFLFLLFRNVLLKDWKTAIILTILNILIFTSVAHFRQVHCPSKDMALFIQGYNVDANDFTPLTDYYNNSTSSIGDYVFDLNKLKYKNLTKVKCMMAESWKDSYFIVIRREFCLYEKD